jgi:copper chaperone
METTINISGMTCGHCVASVTEELKELQGVQDVKVDLKKDGVSAATITSDRELSDSEVSEAVAEAGYLVVANEA